MQVVVCYHVMKEFEVSEKVADSLKSGEDWNNFVISHGVNFNDWNDAEIQGVYAPLVDGVDEIIWER